MRILMRFTSEDRQATKYDNTVAAFLKAKSAFVDDATVADSYLVEPPNYDDHADVIEFIGLIDGAEYPDAIKAIAQYWNSDITANFENKLANLTAKAGKAKDWLNHPTEVYQLRVAAMALDDTFYDFAEQALLVNEYGHFTTVLKDAEKEHILAHPEEYVRIEVHAK